MFCAFATANLVTQAPSMVASGYHPIPMEVTVMAGISLALIWVNGVRRGGFGAFATSAELLGLLLFGLNMGQPSPLLSPIYAALYLRGLYGTNQGAAVRTVGYMVVLELISAVQDPQTIMQQPTRIWTWTLPSFAVNALVVRLLAVTLVGLSHARELNKLLSVVAGQLLVVADTEALRTLVEQCLRRMVPDASVVRMQVDGRRPLVSSRAVVFGLDEGGTHHGQIVVVPGQQPLTRQQHQVLQALAAQVTAAFGSMRLREKLGHRATHDALTDLPNRVLFTESLVEGLRMPEAAVAALFIDIDDFKAVNDTLGHPAGDMLLIEVSARIRRCLRPTDVAARMGGDEFAVLLAPVADGDASRVAGLVLNALDEPFVLDGRLFNLHCSVGIAEARGDRNRAVALANELLRDADIAMYVAKSRGKNRYVRFTPAIARAAMQERAIREQLSAALAGRELELHFQPIVSLDDGEVEMVESLIRWRHPERGLLGPGEFLPQAVRAGLMPDLERWVIGAACAAAATWDGPNPPAVTVNISPQHLHRSWLVPSVKQALAAAGLPGKQLIIEITEEAAVLEPAGAAHNLRECIGLGVRMAMDDFGAGHASLCRLTALPISIVKIDRSLVEHRTGPLVTRAVVELAHDLGLTVVAEGVEDGNQLAWLRDGSCDTVQGYLLSRPVPLDELKLERNPLVLDLGQTVDTDPAQAR